MGKSIRSELMKKLGIRKDEVSKLISTYARNHNGHVDISQIEEDIKKISNSMIYGLGTMYKDYDIKHEILECGKARQMDGILSLLNDNNQQIALSYLPNDYYENVDTWVFTLYHTAQKQLSDILDGDIDSYRDFVQELPYQNINKVAKTFEMEDKVAKFIALNGEFSDFQQFMTDAQPIRDDESELMNQYVSNYSGKLETKSCPRKLSNKIFKNLQEQVKENGNITFEREDMMRGLSVIHNNKKLIESEKEKLQDLFISHYIHGDTDENFVKFAKTDLPDMFETLKEYLEMDSNITWKEKNDFITQKIFPSKHKEIVDAYNKLLKTLMQEVNIKELNPEQIVELISESNLSDDGENYLRMIQDQETKKSKLIVSVPHPVIRIKFIDIELDGSNLKTIIDKINHNSLTEANNLLENYAQEGIGEVSVLYDTNFQYHSKNPIGKIGKEEDSPFLIGGEISDDLGLTDLQMICPYSLISDELDLQNYKAEMTPEQIQQFNHKFESSPIKKHYYTFSDVAGYYDREVLDFELNGEQYHIRSADWTDGGSYSLIWKGEDKNYPDKAMGLSSSHSDWAYKQRGVNKEAAINFISQIPMRFSKFFDENSSGLDCCFCYSAANLDVMCREIMMMQPESKLRETQEKSQQCSNDNFLEEVVESASLKKTLINQEKDAKDLLEEYKKLDPNKYVSISDE